jgi:molecular chaperone Hsp31 and glyoxalase 3
MFSTGNHPVEMLLPMHHMDQAGFEIDIATLSGNPAKLELTLPANFGSLN